MWANFQRERRIRFSSRQNGNSARDNLEKRGLVERRAHPDNRRLYSLHLTQGGGEALERIGRVWREHQEALFSSLSNEEREMLGGLLLKIVDQQALSRGVHPGYQWVGATKHQGPTEIGRCDSSAGPSRR
jgi:hypothetical protein